MAQGLLAGFMAAMMGVGAISFVVPADAAPEAPFVAGQIMVKFRDDAAAAAVLRRHGLDEGPGIGDTGAQLIRVPVGRELHLVDALGRSPAVEYAEPDQVVTPATEDPYYDRQYALDNSGEAFTNTEGDITVAEGTIDADVDASDAWAVTTGNGIKVAVLDSGVDGDHEDISAKVVARANFSSSATRTGDPIAEDHYGHGTHVAGIVAATHDTRGVAGTCPGCTILAGKVLSDSGMGSSSGLANGIDWSVGNGAQVINMSLGVRSSRTLETAVNNAWNKGAVLVAAAGNGGSQNKIYPGAYLNVIAVAATDNNDDKASFSSYGARWVDVAAPGVAVYSTFPNHPFALAEPNNRSLHYDIGNGTSMSSPIVAATAALVWGSDPAATHTSVRAKVESSSDKIDGTGTYWEHGRVNAHRAVTPSSGA